jgi:hypothetical protein
MSVTTFVATGTSARPATALPSGVLFWRLRGTLAGSVGSARSPVWEFWVGASSATVDSSWGSTMDINEDGIADVAVGAYSATVAGALNVGRVYFYFGSSAGLAPSPSMTLTGPDGLGGYFGFSVSSAGDVNGDGFGDLVVGAIYGGTGGNAHVFLGSASGLTAAPATSLIGPDGTSSNFGSAVTGIGDINADGYGDIAVGSNAASVGGMAYAGRVYVFPGSPTGILTTPIATLSGPDGGGGHFGFSLSAGDMNGDGFPDLAVGAPIVTVGGMASVGRVYLYAGSASGLADSP